MPPSASPFVRRAHRYIQSHISSVQRVNISSTDIKIAHVKAGFSSLSGPPAFSCCIVYSLVGNISLLHSIFYSLIHLFKIAFRLCINNNSLSHDPVFVGLCVHERADAPSWGLKGGYFGSAV